MMLKQTQNNLRNIDQIIKDLGQPEAHGGSFGELFIHSMIETIEFVLGCVSNTASYLRLWALSLAHTELAVTFFSLIFKNQQILRTNDISVLVVLGIILWPMFWSVTFAVLMMMDMLECFLHCIRLHWVEFQNKFYKGNGYPFKPYKFENILNGVLDA